MKFAFDPLRRLGPNRYPFSNVRRLPVLTLLLISCSGAPTPRECKALANLKAVVKRCYEHKLDPSAKYVGDLRCWPFSKPERLRGIWVIDLESSEFFPNASSIKDASGQPMWLESELLNQSRELLDAAQGAGRRIFAVELEGRKSLCDGHFGHLGMTPRQVIALRFYSMRPLPNPVLRLKKKAAGSLRRPS